MRFSTAICVSVALHGVLAAGIAAYLTCAPGPTTLAKLDLTSVELSFAEEDSETAEVAPSLPAPAHEEPPRPPEEKPPEPKLEKPDIPLPPDPESAAIPEPKPEVEHMEPPPQKPQEEKKPAPTPAPTAAPSPAVAPRQAKIDAPPKPRRSIRPEYPQGARQRGEQGDVVVEIRVNDRGAVDDVSIVSSCGFPELDNAAVRAAKSARFTPAKSGDKSVASTARLTLTFRLR